MLCLTAECGNDNLSMTRTDDTLVIREASPADRSKVERLLAGYALPVQGVPESMAGYVVAEVAGEVVGVVGLEEWGNFGLLRSAAVASEWKGRGVGRELVARILERAASNSLDAVYLLTTTAERYFPSFGFVLTTREAVPDVVRSSVEFQGACPVSALVMVWTDNRPDRA